MFRGIFDEHSKYAGRMLRRLGVPKSDLDDALQDVFIVVFARLHSYEERGSIHAWLYSICFRVASNHRRVLTRRKLALATGSETRIEPTPHDYMEEREAIAVGQRLLNELSPEQREVYWQYEVEERSMPEIARTLGWPLQTAYARLHRARKRMVTAVKLSLSETAAGPTHHKARELYWRVGQAGERLEQPVAATA